MIFLTNNSAEPEQSRRADYNRQNIFNKCMQELEHWNTIFEKARFSKLKPAKGESTDFEYTYPV